MAPTWKGQSCTVCYGSQQLNVTIEYMKYDQYKLRCTVSVKYTLVLKTWYKNNVKDIVNHLYIDYIL